MTFLRERYTERSVNMAYVKISFITFFGLVITGCGFYSLKGSIPAHIKSISLSPVVNESSEFGVSENLEIKLTDRLISDNALEVTGEDIADSRLNVIITSVKDQPYTISTPSDLEYEVVDEWRITISTKVVWYDLTRNEPLFEKNMSDWGAYGTGLDIHSDGIDNDNDGFLDAEDDDEYGSPRESAIEFALRKLAERIITEVTSTW